MLLSEVWVKVKTSYVKIKRMEFFERTPTIETIKRLQKKWETYLKVTVDIENGWIVVGGELHCRRGKLLLEKGSEQENIWGGGISLKEKLIDTNAVLNLRPQLNNNGLEILDPQKREKFINLVKTYFSKLWN